MLNFNKSSINKEESKSFAILYEIKHINDLRLILFEDIQ